MCATIYLLILYREVVTVEKSQITVVLNANDVKRAKAVAAVEGRSLSDLARSVINSYCREHVSKLEAVMVNNNAEN